jgi:predicted Zn-dependent protease
MNPLRISLAALFAALSGATGSAQTPADSPLPKSGQLQFKPDTASGEALISPSPRADAYYNYAMGHLFEQQYETTNQPEFATQAIDAYKKAYALDPKSPVIGERLAEMYWKAQRVHEAVTEAQELLKRDPNDLQTRRLLGRIYLRSLGDLTSTAQSEMAARAIEQYKEVYRLDPADSE